MPVWGMLNTRRFPLAPFAPFLIPSLLPSLSLFILLPIDSPIGPCVSLHFSLSLSLSSAPRHPHPRGTGPRRVRARGPCEINSPSLPFPSPSPSRPTKVADVRRRLHLHCHYESAHIARGMSFLLRAPVWLYHPRPCARVRACGEGEGGGLTSIV